jgi:hypothetical protein
MSISKQLNINLVKLNDTDHKMYSDYERKEDETQEVMDYIKEQQNQINQLKNLLECVIFRLDNK